MSSIEQYRNADRIIRRGLRLSAVGLLGLLLVYVLALKYTPVEARQGVAQKFSTSTCLRPGARSWRSRSLD